MSEILVGLFQIPVKSYAIELTLNKREKNVKAVNNLDRQELTSGVVLTRFGVHQFIIFTSFSQA